MAIENSDPDVHEYQQVTSEPHLDTRIQMCANFNALSDLFSSQETFDPLVYTPAKLSRIHRLDTDALQYKPPDARRGYVPVQVFGDGNCFPRTLAIAIGKDLESEHRSLRKRMCQERVENKPCYLNHQYLS